jgi:hypothetical protein
MRDRKGGRNVRTEIGRADTQRVVAEGAQLVEVLPREEFDMATRDLPSVPVTTSAGERGPS